MQRPAFYVPQEGLGELFSAGGFVGGKRPFVQGHGERGFLAACLQNQELRRLPTSRSAWLVQWFLPASRRLRGVPYPPLRGYFPTAVGKQGERPGTSSVSASPIHLPQRGRQGTTGDLFRPLRGHLPQRGRQGIDEHQITKSTSSVSASRCHLHQRGRLGTDKHQRTKSTSSVPPTAVHLPRA